LNAKLSNIYWRVKTRLLGNEKTVTQLADFELGLVGYHVYSSVLRKHKERMIHMATSETDLLSVCEQYIHALPGFHLQKMEEEVQVLP
jgi:hypothetical protein